MDRYPYEFQAGESLNRPPLWNGLSDTYLEWKKRMTLFIQAQDIELWKVIVHGPYIIQDCEGCVKKETDYTNEDWQKVHINSKSMHLLLCSLCTGARQYVSPCENAQEIWNKLEFNHRDGICRAFAAASNKDVFGIVISNPKI